MDELSQRPNTRVVAERLDEICREGALEPPDVVLGLSDDEVLALWFASRTAAVVSETGDVGEADDELVGRVAGAVERIAWICDEGGLRKPDGMRFGEGPDGREWVSAHWHDEGFHPAWPLEDLLAPIRAE